MTLTLYKEDFIDASHRLNDYDGKCSNIHGHTWKICIWIRGDEADLQPNGILWDFGNIKKITSMLDHKNLNEVLPDNPTAEHITLFIYRQLKKDYPHLLFKIRVFENAVSKLAYCESGDFE